MKTWNQIWKQKSNINFYAIYMWRKRVFFQNVFKGFESVFNVNSIQGKWELVKEREVLEQRWDDKTLYHSFRHKFQAFFGWIISLLFHTISCLHFYKKN